MGDDALTIRYGPATFATPDEHRQAIAALSDCLALQGFALAESYTIAEWPQRELVFVPHRPVERLVTSIALTHNDGDS